MSPGVAEKSSAKPWQFKKGYDPRREGNGAKRLSAAEKAQAARQRQLDAAALAGVVAELQPALQKYSGAALAKLVQLMSSADESIALAATRDLLDRCFGKAPQAVAIDLNAKLTVEGTKVLTLADLQQAALRIAADMATDAVSVGAGEPGLLPVQEVRKDLQVPEDAPPDGAHLQPTDSALKQQLAQAITMVQPCPD